MSKNYVVNNAMNFFRKKKGKDKQTCSVHGATSQKNYNLVNMQGIRNYCIAEYIGGNNVWRIARKRKKIAIGGYKFGGYGTITTPSPRVYAILVDLILAV